MLCWIDWLALFVVEDVTVLVFLIEVVCGWHFSFGYHLGVDLFLFCRLDLVLDVEQFLKL